MNNLKGCVFALTAFGVMSACAWTCEKCGAQVDDDYNYCDRTNCGAAKPKPKPMPAYTPTPVSAYTPKPESTYTPQRKSTDDEPEWYNGKPVKKTPLHIGLLGPDLAFPPGEYYSVYGACTDPLVATVVNSYGMEIASLCATTHKAMYGLQVGGIATSAQKMEGIQIGLFNFAHSAGGVQIGCINRAEKMSGVQIGLINIIEESSVQFFPVINAHF